MKFALPTLLCLLQGFTLFAQTSSPVSAATPFDQDKCSISGTVVRQDTGEPLAKAKLTLNSTDKREDSVFDITDSQGHFLLDDLPCHSYYLSASHPGFVDFHYGQRKPTDPGAILALSQGQKMTDLVFKLQRTAVVAGRVFDENGDLVQGAAVRVIHRIHVDNRHDFQEDGQALTNDLGEFRIFDLKPGRYYISASYTPWSAEWGGLGAAPRRQLSKKGYPVIFYPGTADPSKAQTLTLNSGDELATIDFRLLLTSMNTVSGKILNITAISARQNMSVLLVPRGSELATVSGGDPQNLSSNGSFTFYGVPPGSYYIQASYIDWENKWMHSARREVEVTGADLDGLTLAFSPGSNLVGRVIWDAKDAADYSDLMLFLFSTDEDSFGTEPQTVKPDSFFQFRNVSEGEYRPSVRSTSQNCYLKSARLGTTSMMDGKLSIHPGSDNSLEYTVSCRAPQISGQVLTADSLPAIGVFVVLVPELRLRDDPHSYFTERTDQSGHFLLKGVKPGDYKLFSWDSVERDDWQDADFLKPYEEKGFFVHLDEADRKSVELTVLEPPKNVPSPNE